MNTTRFALGLVLSLFCMHCTAEAGGGEADHVEQVETTESALTTVAGDGDTGEPATATAEKGKKKKAETQEYMIVTLENVLVSN